MALRWLLATVHLLALPLGLAGVWLRARALSGPLDDAGLRRGFAADNAWGISALILIPTGLLRAFAGFEKGAEYYLSQPAFHLKMGLLVLVLLLEIRPMVTLIRWRARRGRGDPIDPRPGRALSRISYVQALLVALMVAAATAMARGVMP